MTDNLLVNVGRLEQKRNRYKTIIFFAKDDEREKIREYFFRC